ncbi:MAG: SIS domain-containing protein [Vicinamibacterales bacterium]
MDAHTAVSDAAVIQAVFDETIALHQRMRDAIHESVIEAVSAIRASLAAGGKLLVFGNGGSAADAQHMTAEMVGRFEREREGLAAIALTADASILTSVANDFTFDWVFARQIEALGKREDVALGISTSGRSPNVLTALEAANAKGMKTVALTGGDGGVIGKAAAIHINVPHPSTARVQEVHRTVIHAICALVERTRS